MAKSNHRRNLFPYLTGQTHLTFKHKRHQSCLFNVLYALYPSTFNSKPNPDSAHKELNIGI